MGSLARRKRSVSGSLARFIPTGSLAGLGAIAALDANFFLAGVLGAGAAYAGSRLLDRERNQRKELARWTRENVRDLRMVAWEDRIAAPQMKRLIKLQHGLLESWELLPEDYRPLLDEDIFTLLGEVEASAFLARRRSALRKHLESVDRRSISGRIRSLERDIEDLPPGSPLLASFESALAGRREELDRCDDILGGISAINAQLEGMESLLGNLRGELLALDTRIPAHSLEPDLASLKSRVGYFRSSLDEVTRSVEPIHTASATGRAETI